MSLPRRTRLDFIKNLPKLNLQQAKRKIMDLLSQRDHSIKELSTKLKRRAEPEVVKEALDWAAQHNWLPSEEKIQEQIVRIMGQKGRGQNSINLKLKKIGLKPTKLDPETELSNALGALKLKFESDLLTGLEYKELLKKKSKVLRFLAGKGFNAETCIKAVKQYFKK